MKEFEGLKIPENFELEVENIIPEGLEIEQLCIIEQVNKCHNITCEECINNFKNLNKFAKYILTHHGDMTDNIIPFGFLSEEMKEIIKEESKLGNVKYLNQSEWMNRTKSDYFFYLNTIYRTKPKPKHTPEAIAKAQEVLEESGYKVTKEGAE